MLRISHVIWSFMISLWLFYLLKFSLLQIILFSIIVAFFSPLPDVDLKIVNYFKKLNKKSFYLLTPVYLIVKFVFKHRGLTHSFLFSFVFLFLYMFLNFFNGLIFRVLGYAFLLIFISISLHILEDSLTVTGVKPFWPITIINIKFANFSTDNDWHNLFLNTLALIGIFFFFYFNVI